MILERDNILTLIGSKRYHSCILTTFSFDFLFFEMKAMKWLRSCGVRNVNVFVDGHYYSELMKQATGEEMQLTPGYSLYPIFQKSIFHPKIWMLFGEKEGLLIVGSGNLTNSGNGNNDEIWGAFHFDVHSIQNASIFSEAWAYVSLLSSSVRGQMNEKTSRWIVEHSKWLQELPKVIPFQFYSTAQKEQIAFLYNSATTSIWQELLKHTTNEKIIEITCISPFYDSNGKALQEIKSRFPSAEINVVLDESGIIPSSMSANESFKFYNWTNAGVSKIQYSKSDNGNSKLHGKIIHFKTKSGKEFCLFGSANITPEGLGISGGKNSNAEVSILVLSENGDLLKGLGINLKSDNRKKLSDFVSKTPRSILNTVLTNNQFIIYLLSAELVYDELTIYSTGSHSGNIELVLFDKQNRLLYSMKLNECKNEIKIKLNREISNIQYAQFADGSGNFVSNKILVSDYFLIAKTHPNPRMEDIERLYSEIQNGELSKVLDLLPYAILDEAENEDGINILHSSKRTETRRDDIKDPEKLYDLSTYKPQERSAFEKHLLLSSLSLRVLDVIKFINAKAFSSNREEGIRVDEQESDLGNISGNEESEVKSIRNFSHALLKSEKKKLLNYFNNLYDNQQDILYGKRKALVYKPTLTDLTKYLIALELIIEYGGKTEKYDEEGKQHFFNYLSFTGDYYNDNVKGCCLNIIGDFLMMAGKGFKEYEFEYTKKKIAELRSEAIISTIVCLINTHWQDNELHYFYSMSLNALHYVSLDTDNPDLIDKITRRISELKQRTNKLEENKQRFINIVLPAFKKVVKRIADKNFDTAGVQGQIVYKSPWGYCLVQAVKNGNEYSLVRPGFYWDDSYSEYIKHNSDKIYTPIKLNTLIQVI